MNALEKYAAKRHLINLLIEKLANPAPPDVRARANSMFGEMKTMAAKRRSTSTSTGPTTPTAPRLGAPAAPRPTPPAAPRRAAPVPPTPSIPRPSKPMRGPSTTKPMAPPAPKPTTNRPARTTVMQGSTGANVQGGFKFDRGAAMKSYQPGKYSKNPHMDRTIHMNRARRDALKAYQAKQGGK